MAMKHLNQDQLLDWIESGRADEASREHLKNCPQCASELSSLREVYQMLATHDPAADLDADRALQFTQDLRRKIRLLPEPSPFQMAWGFLQRAVFTHPAIIGAVATAVVVFSVMSIFRYDKMRSPGASEPTMSAPGGANSATELAASMAVADALVANQNLQASDLVEASVGSTGEVDAAMGEVNGPNTDPFHDVTDLKPDEVDQLKALLKKHLKG